MECRLNLPLIFRHKKNPQNCGFFVYLSELCFNRYVATAKLTFHFEFYYAISSSKIMYGHGPYLRFDQRGIQYHVDER